MSTFVVLKTDIAGLRQMERLLPKANPTIVQPSELNGSEENVRYVALLNMRLPIAHFFSHSFNVIQNNVSPTTDDPFDDAILERVTDSGGADNLHERYVHIPAIFSHSPNGL